MASINYHLRSTKDKNTVFTLRFQFVNPDKISPTNKQGFQFLEAKTEIYVFNPEEVKASPLLDGIGFWNKYKKGDPKHIDISNRIARIKKEQDDLKNFILQNVQSDTILSKEWLISKIDNYYDNIKRLQAENKSKETPSNLTYHFDNYIKIKSVELKERTLVKLQDTKNIISDFETFISKIKGYSYKVDIKNIDDLFKYEIINYLSSEKKYSHNTIAKTIKIIRTICNYSTRYGIQLNSRYVDFKMAYEDKEVVFLSFLELKRIKETEVPSELKNAKEWLYLSCFLGQRISDFMRFKKNMIQKKGDKYTIEFTQTKTNKKLSLLIHPEVLEYLKKNDFNFPEVITEIKYNDQIKKVCELAGINDKVKGSILKEVKKGVWRKVTDVYFKYELISSHIGRKSFASNFYGLIPTTLIMQVTAHGEERSLLEYIGKKDNTNNELIQEYYNKINISL